MVAVLHLNLFIEKWLFTPSVEPPGLWELWESRVVEWWRDFQRVWEGPGGGGWWSGAFHTRSASIARVGEGHLYLDSFRQSAEARPGLRADLRAGLGEPRVDLRAAPRDILRPPPPSAPFGMGCLADGGRGGIGTKPPPIAV